MIDKNQQNYMDLFSLCVSELTLLCEADHVALSIF